LKSPHLEDQDADFSPSGGVKSGADVGAKEYLLGVVGEDLEGHEMANILGNANEASQFFM
jgi:bifunctional ADP-heptose synthase (sugar kinase/adenylyltransferase)